MLHMQHFAFSIADNTLICRLNAKWSNGVKSLWQAQKYRQRSQREAAPLGSGLLLVASMRMFNTLLQRTFNTATALALMPLLQS